MTKTRAIQGILVGAGLTAVVLLAATVWLGHPPPPAVWLGKPKGLLLIAGFSGFAAHLLGRRPWRSRRRAAVFLGEWTLLLLSLALALFIAERIARGALRRHQARGDLHDLIQERDDRFLLGGGFTPLAAIIRRSSNPRLIYDLQPHLDMEFGRRRLRTNAAGMRADRDFDLRKPDGVFRIVGIGDSFMFGWGNEQGEDFLSRLEERLNRRGPERYEVLNFAVPGYNTRQEVDILLDRGLAYDPDVVILGWCDNDFGPPFLIEKAWDKTGRRSVLYSLLFYRDEVLTPRMFRASELEAAEIDPEILKYIGVEGVRRSLDELQGLAAESGFQVLVIGNMNQQITAIADDLGIPYFNTRERIPPDRYPEEYAIHFMHPRAEGHRALAGYLEAELAELGWLPPSHRVSPERGP